MFVKTLICLGLCALIGEVFADEGPVPQATTPLGKVTGSYKTSTDGRTFAAFEGIPYAKPPVGDLRFSEPKPIEKWNGTWHANTLVTCVQSGYLDGKVIGTEDCLYINVYVPRKEMNPSENLDVIVHIHGGGYLSGSGHEYCGPEHLMDRDIVYVTMNYRVNLFGFLSMADEVLPGNYGLKDQVLSLKWIQDNIASFGGNPKSVTLTGLSAGASSVHYHYLSPLSKGLFHRGLSQSGAAILSYALQDKPVEQTKRLAELAGCSVTDSNIIANCLRQRNADFLTQKLKDFTLIDGVAVGAIAPFAPSIEKGLKNAFLPENPYYLLTQTEILDVPWITSFAANESVLVTSMVVPNLPTINEKWDQLAPTILDYNYTVAPSDWSALAQSVKRHYFGNKDISLETAGQYTEMLSQRYCKMDSETAAKLQSKANKSPVYFYVFNYTSSLSITNVIPNNPLKGVAHGDDSFYMFYPAMFSDLDLTYSPQDIALKNQFLDMITSFAKTNVPSFNGVTWEPTKESELSYLQMNGPTDMKMVVTKQLTDRDFWSDLGILENENVVNSNKD